MVNEFLKLGVPIKQNIYKVLFSVILIVVGGIANIFLIGMISDALQSSNGQQSIRPVLFVLALVLAFFLNVFAQFILDGVGHQIVFEIRENLLQRIVHSDPESFQQLEKSKVYNAFSKDIPAILFAVQIMPYTLYGVSLIVAGLCYMLWLSWSLALVIIVALFFVVSICNFIVSVAEKKHARDRAIHDNLVTAYGNIIYGHKELALNEVRRKEIVDAITEGDALDSKNLQTSAGRLISVSSQLMGVLPIALVGIVLWSGKNWSDGVFLVGINFAVVLMFIRQPIGNLVHQVENILHAKTALQHLHALNLPAVHSLIPAIELSRDWKTINVKRVEYKYSGNERFYLGPMDLQINRGETTFLVGSNGAGKSTLLEILCGLITPQKGDILIDDEKVCDENRRQYRAMFSAVLSNYFIFDTVDKKDDINSASNIEQFIHLLELEGVLSFCDGRVDTLKLSTGQKKRLAMVVACLENRSIMVLDEWAADQDPRFRKIFYEQILPELKSQGVTLVVVSHDDQYFHTADKVVSIEL